MRPVMHPFGQEPQRKIRQIAPGQCILAELEMADVVQQAHLRFGKLDNIEQAGVDAVEIANPQLKLIAADAVGNLRGGHGIEAVGQLRVFFRQQTDKDHRIHTRQRHHPQTEFAHHLTFAQRGFRL